MELHKKRVHLNVRNYKCNICGDTFKKSIGLKTHMYRHTGEKPFKCTHEGCEKYFRSTNIRELHMRLHTGEKPYHCTIDGCNRRSTYWVDFSRHKYRQHAIFTKKFICHICTEVFPEGTRLKAHMKVHE